MLEYLQKRSKGKGIVGEGGRVEYHDLCILFYQEIAYGIKGVLFQFPSDFREGLALHPIIFTAPDSHYPEAVPSCYLDVVE